MADRLNTDVDVERAVLTTLADVVRPASIKDATISRAHDLRRDLGLDSIGLVLMLFTFEKRFGVDIVGAAGVIDLGQLKTVDDLVRAGQLLVARTKGAHSSR